MEWRKKKKEVLCVIKEVREGSGVSRESRSMCDHHEIAATIRLIRKRFYWRTIALDVTAHVKSCIQCQKVNPKMSNEAPMMHSVQVPNAVMKQPGIDICSLPENNGFKYIVVAIDYFSKWTEAKPIIRKDACSVVLFLYKLIPRHSCFDIQINDQGQEFVIQVSETLHQLTGVKQKVITDKCIPPSSKWSRVKL